MTGRPVRLIVGCPHGGNRLPAPYRPLFAGQEPRLRSHQGYDAGALRLARELAAALDAPLFRATVSRLLIDLNRSLGHPRLYSERTRAAPRTMREEILERYYLPYRRGVERCVAEALAAGLRVVHVDVHSFTPRLGEVVRQADVGFLYDPVRPPEKTFCLHWMAALRRLAPGLRLRRNYPYAGRADGFRTWLRRRHAAEDYVGIELEVNQRHVIAGGTVWRQLRSDIAASLKTAVEEAARPAV